MVTRNTEKYSYNIIEQDGKPVLVPDEKLGEKLYYRYPDGDDIVSDYIIHNYYEGELDSAPDTATLVKDDNTYYFKKDGS